MIEKTNEAKQNIPNFTGEHQWQRRKSMKKTDDLYKRKGRKRNMSEKCQQK
jgi:hypothetical protein